VQKIIKHFAQKIAANFAVQSEDFVAPIDDEEHLLFSCKSTKDIRFRFAGLPMSSLRSLMQCEDVGSVAWFVHECMERVDNSHTG
jgi:hypothetical protein